MTRRILIASILITMPGCQRPQSAAPRARPFTSHRIAIMYYGYGDATWSGGLNNYAAAFQDQGRDARCYRFQDWPAVADAILASDADDIVLVGHSFGGDAAIKTCRAVTGRRRVRLIVLLDASAPSGGTPSPLTATRCPDSIPTNVDRALVFCIPNTPVLNRWPCPRVDSEIPIEAARVMGADHFGIDDSDEIMRTVVEAATP